MSRLDDLRLITKIARLYYEQGKRQSDIAKQLNLSQATISRFLRRAQDEQIVRITVNMPQGIFLDLEEALLRKFDLHDAIVTDGSREDEEYILRNLGGAAAYYVEATIKENQTVGLSSWSETLLAMVDAMHGLAHPTHAKVVQILGGIGSPSAEVYATRLLERFSSLVRGTAIQLPAPGILGSEEAMTVLLDDPYVQHVRDMFDEVDMALVGIGDVEPSKLLAQSGNRFSESELETLRAQGAVGDMLLRFFDSDGRLIETPLDKRVASMSLEQLRKVERAIGIAGGRRKYEAILGALRGGWINVLITDRMTAEWLLVQPDGRTDPSGATQTPNADP